jgi:hypothetical protein
MGNIMAFKWHTFYHSAARIAVAPSPGADYQWTSTERGGRIVERLWLGTSTGPAD